MQLTYKKGDIFTRVMLTDGKFVTTTYKSEDFSPHENRSKMVRVELTMIATTNPRSINDMGKTYYIPISANFTDDGVESCINESDLFTIGDNPQTINKAKAIILNCLNTSIRKSNTRT